MTEKGAEEQVLAMERLLLSLQQWQVIRFVERDDHIGGQHLL